MSFSVDILSFLFGYKLILNSLFCLLNESGGVRTTCCQYSRIYFELTAIGIGAVPSPIEMGIEAFRDESDPEGLSHSWV